MKDYPARTRRIWYAVLAAVMAFGLGVGYACFFKPSPPSNPEVDLDSAPLPEATAEQVRQVCAACHAYPPPDSFPRSHWRREVNRGYDLLLGSNLDLVPPTMERVVRYYENRASEELPLPARPTSAPRAPVRFERNVYTFAESLPTPTVSNVNLVKLFDDRRPDVLVTDQFNHQVLVLKPYEASPKLQLLAKVPAPARTEVVDLDGDGVRDILVACLGSHKPTDERVGSLVWLKGGGNGTFTPVTLMENVGRVADVRAADFNGDKKLDLLVAVFGWETTGEIVLLENRTTDWSRPELTRHVLDPRDGTIHVPVCDLNGDGRPDFVALISQEHETVVAFINDGENRFHRETIYEAPHPAYGSSGIQLSDLDGDGDLDVLFTNGDVLDPPFWLKPYHGVQWLENRGRFPFVHHPLAPMCGAHAALAGDLDGDGDQDIIALSFLPGYAFPQRDELDLHAIILFEQTARGEFTYHALKRRDCDHVTCALGDLYGDGRLHLVLGNFYMHAAREVNSVEIWKNLGKPKD